MRKLISSLLKIVLLIFICGCMTVSGPTDNSPFTSKVNIAGLVGKYQNLGEGAVGATPVYLSMLVMPDALGLDHRSVQIVEVIQTSEKTLLLQAKDKKGILGTREVEEGKDFEIKNGRIWLKKNSGISTLLPVGNPLLGYFSEEESIGIDKNGNGKFETNFSSFGTAFILVPLIGSRKEQIRFQKISP